MKRYVGQRGEDGTCRVFVEELVTVRAGPPWEPAERATVIDRRVLPHPRYHSPSGLEWGYGGSGPADLALAVLVDLFDEGSTIPQIAFRRYEHAATEAIGRTRAWRIHQAFKWAWAAALPHAGWCAEAEALQRLADRLEQAP